MTNTTSTPVASLPHVVDLVRSILRSRREDRLLQVARLLHLASDAPDVTTSTSFEAYSMHTHYNFPGSAGEIVVIEDGENVTEVRILRAP